MAYFPPLFYPHTQEWSFSHPSPVASPAGPSSTSSAPNNFNPTSTSSPRVKPGRTISGFSMTSTKAGLGRNWGLGIKTHGIHLPLDEGVNDHSPLHIHNQSQGQNRINGSPLSTSTPTLDPNSKHHPDPDINDQNGQSEPQTYSLNDTPKSFKDYLVPPLSGQPHLPSNHLGGWGYTPQNQTQTQAGPEYGHGTYSSSPIQSSPPHPHPHSHPHLSTQSPPSPPSTNTSPTKKTRRGILVPAHYRLTPGTTEAVGFARLFGRFGFEGEVVIGGAGGSGPGWGIWVVDKWVTDPTRPLKTIIVPTSTSASVPNNPIHSTPTNTTSSAQFPVGPTTNKSSSPRLHGSPTNSNSPTYGKPKTQIHHHHHHHNHNSHAPNQTHPGSTRQENTITLHLLTPLPSLSEVQATREIEAAVRLLRKGRDGFGAGNGGSAGFGAGGRGIETEWGVMVVTSLSNLRQDVQPVLIPSGDVRNSLPLIHTLLNLRRLGASSRQSLSLEPPSPATQFKFYSLYRFQHSPGGAATGRFHRTVGELVRVMKVALKLWGFTPGSAEDDDGPGEEGLCTDGMIRRLGEWRLMMKGFGNHALDTALGTRPSEGSEEMLASHGPPIAAALLSSITSIRVKLASLDLERVPRDPFTKKRDFETSLASFQRLYMHRTSNVIDHLDMNIYAAITDQYNREKHHDQTRLTRRFKDRAAQAGSNIVSNLSMGLGRERDRDSGEEPYDTADDENADSGTLVGPASAPDNITPNLDCFVRLVVTGKAGVGFGRLRNLWTDKVTDHPREGRKHHHHRDTQIVHDYAFDRMDQRETAVEGDLDTVDELLLADRRRHHRHRSLAPSRKGTLRNMTSKTGHALKDWASRRGTRPGESGDEQTTSAPPSVANFRQVPSKQSSVPVVILPDEDDPSFGSSSQQRSHALGPSSDLYSSLGSYRTPSESSRPSIVTNLSYIESETFDEAGSEHGPLEHVPVTRSNRTSMTDDGTVMEKNKSRLLGRPRRPLERMVSTGSPREALEAGAEWIHWGHVDRVYGEELAKQVRSRGLQRRWSFESLIVPGQLEFIHHRYLKTDMDLCAVILAMRERDRQLQGKVEAYAALEAAVSAVTTTYVREIKARRAQLERLAEQAQALLSDPDTASSKFTNRSDSDVIKESHRLEASRKLVKQLTLKNDKLTYSSRELDKNVASVEVAKGELESFVSKYIKQSRPGHAIDHGEDDSAQSSETGWKGWFRIF